MYIIRDRFIIHTNSFTYHRVLEIALMSYNYDIAQMVLFFTIELNKIY